MDDGRWDPATLSEESRSSASQGHGRRHDGDEGVDGRERRRRRGGSSCGSTQVTRSVLGWAQLTLTKLGRAGMLRNWSWK